MATLGRELPVTVGNPLAHVARTIAPMWHMMSEDVHSVPRETINMGRRERLPGRRLSVGMVWSVMNGFPCNR